MKLDWKAFVGVGITAFLFWLIFRDIDVGEVWAALRQAHWGFLLASVAVSTFGFVFRALRWNVLLQPVRPNTTFRNRFAAVNIGFMANNLLPARVGEFARAFALSKLEPVTMSAALGSLVVERVLDAVVLIGILVAVMMSPGFPEVGALSGPLATAVPIIVGGLIGLSVLLAALVTFPKRVVTIAERLATRLPGDLERRVVSGLESFLGSLTVLRTPRLLLPAVLWSVAFWLWHGISFWLGMLAFDIDAGLLAAFFTEAVVGFGVSVPAAPGFFGTFHYSANFALATFGVSEPSALAFAFGYHLGGFIPVTVIGLYYAGKMGLSLKDMGSSETRVEAAVERDSPVAARAAAGRRAAGPPDELPPAAVRVDAPAKVNLALRVLGTRPDGYHELETIFQALDLCDRVEIRREGTGLELAVTGEDAGPNADNLAMRAARAYLADAGLPATTGLRISLTKSIPARAGLGGGSSDAAATLKALDRLFDGIVPPARLAAIAAGLGSDVPFFLAPTPLAIARGRGERLEPLATLPGIAGVVVMPDAAVATADAYRELDARRASAGSPPHTGTLGPLRAWDHAAALAANDFEDAVTGSRPEIAQALAALRATGPIVALLCGSGAACFALYRSEGAADEAAREVAHTGRVLRVRTLAAWPELVDL